ncbi:MAG: NUDIX hydrolase [Bacteroidales bacterium]|nr:NUDIX hydrolase [Bacteroidales bacterium]
MTYTYDYPRALVTVDIIITDNNNRLLVIKRGNDPFKNMWALPGGFIEMDEKLVDSATRELQEETGLTNINLKQFKAYGDPGRDPRGRNIVIVFYGKCSSPNDVIAGDDAAETHWFELNNLPELAFDHKQIVDDFLANCFS